MDKFLVKGNQALGGEVKIHGAKNSALPILAASILIQGESDIHNCPDLTDVNEALRILEYLGAKVRRNASTVTVNAAEIVNNTIPEEMMKSMRSSIIFLGSLIGRTGEASLTYPGGCEIGLRPIDIHINALRSLGVTVQESGCSVACNAPYGIRGSRIFLPFPSVGATENIIIAAAVSKGHTTIVNPAREPEISDLAEFLNSAGARIFGTGEGTIEIDGVSRLSSTEHVVIPDRILATTMMAVSALSGSELVLRQIQAGHIGSVFQAFGEMGCRLYLEGKSLRIQPPKRKIKRVKEIKTMPYPGFPTDCQAPVMSALLKSAGSSVIVENIFENRFLHVPQLNRFGADISVNNKVAVITGVKELYGAGVKATDLRGGAALVIAALAAQGDSVIEDIHHIDRGYENFEGMLASIGADIKRLKDGEGT